MVGIRVQETETPGMRCIACDEDECDHEVTFFDRERSRRVVIGFHSSCVRFADAIPTDELATKDGAS